MGSTAASKLSEANILTTPLVTTDQNPKHWHLVAITAAGAVALHVTTSTLSLPLTRN